MAKSKPESKPSSSALRRGPRPPKDAVGVGESLARLDAEIAALAQRRARLAQDAAEAGGEVRGAAIDSLTNERLEKLTAESEGPLSATALGAVFRELDSACRALVRLVRVAMLGPEYSYSHLAAMHRFGQGVDYLPVGTIGAVFEEVFSRNADFGIVPIENSTDGRVADSLDKFTKIRVPICGMLEMRIHHTLLGNCQRAEIQEVYSRPQALSQCRDWLSRHLPGARTIEVTSTTTAAQLAKEKHGAAAIASRQAGVHYGLCALAENIEDNPNNITRFAVIGYEAPPRTGQDRTALLFQMEHRPGTLADAMNIFKRHQVNLTWIESFPVPEMERAYLFFVEMEGYQTDARLKRAIRALERKALRLEVLGSFPAARTFD